MRPGRNEHSWQERGQQSVWLYLESEGIVGPVTCWGQCSQVNDPRWMTWDFRSNHLYLYMVCVLT